MNKHSPAFTKMLLFNLGIKINLFMFLPLIIISGVIIFFCLINIPDESNVCYITTSISHHESNHYYSFTYNTDDEWKLGRYYILGWNNELIDINIDKITQIESGGFEIFFTLINKSDCNYDIVNHTDIKILCSKTFLQKIFSFFTE